MIIFFVSYCYTRYNEQFDDVQAIMHAINDACLSARCCFADPDEVRRGAATPRRARSPRRSPRTVHH